MADILSKLPESLILGFLGLIAVTVLLVPLTLRMAGLTSSQIVDLLTLTMKFFLDLIQQFRAQNKS